MLLVSDFLDEGFEKSNCAWSLVRHDTVAVQLQDPREKSLPSLGLVTLFDPETNRDTTAGYGKSCGPTRRFVNLLWTETHNLKYFSGVPGLTT